MMNDAVAEGGGENFANNGFFYDMRFASGWFVGSIDDRAFEIFEILESVDFKNMFIFGFSFTAFSGIKVSPIEFEFKIKHILALSTRL